jgi:hypothetical protein
MFTVVYPLLVLRLWEPQINNLSPVMGPVIMQ